PPSSPPLVPYTTLFRSLSAFSSKYFTTPMSTHTSEYVLSPGSSSNLKSRSSPNASITALSLSGSVSSSHNDRISNRSKLSGPTRSEEHTSELQSRFDLV